MNRSWPKAEREEVQGKTQELSIPLHLQFLNKRVNEVNDQRSGACIIKQAGVILKRTREQLANELQRNIY